ncbi:MAG: low molecular weight phosphotyrosine protein phosphatase [Eudoraea sp.]|nr:low molecular weight phosphotyrosine protein phosphatase [Eudoraea sp.]
MKIKVLMVCLGNICRSPLAEGILRSKVDPSRILIDSAGTAGYHVGSAPDPRSIEVAKEHHIDISGQRCRKFQMEDFHSFDHIFVMDRENFGNVCSLAPSEDHKKKVRLLLEGTDSNYTEVPDPYYGGKHGFQEVYHLIDKACDMLIKDILT